MRSAVLTAFGAACLLGSALGGRAQVGGVVDTSARAQRSFSLSGYVQPQYQWGMPGATLRVGVGVAEGERGYSRMGIRRGRIRLAGQQGPVRGVLQIDATERGLALKDAYAQIDELWLGCLALRAGVFNRPFGLEVGYSSARRESPERALVIRTLFPDERDVGAMVSLQPPAGSLWHLLRVEAGLFAGNGVERESDSRRDFIGRIGVRKSFGGVLEVGVGFSYYRGSVWQGTSRVFRMRGGAFVLHEAATNQGAFARREYYGGDALLAWQSVLGRGALRAEWIIGQQPGTAVSSFSPNSAKRPTVDTYVRPFAGGYAMLTHTVGPWPVTLVVKCDWYDPNTAVVAAHAATEGDVAHLTIGTGAVWDLSDAFRLLAYYDWVRNELAPGVLRYVQDLRDDCFTLRCQYRF